MKDLPTWSDLNKGVRKMTDKEFEYCEEMEKRKHDEKVRELEEQIEKMKCNNTLCRHNGVTEKICCCKNPETFCKYLKSKEIIREYIRLSLQEDKDIDANVKLFQKAEAFLKEQANENN